MRRRTLVAAVLVAILVILAGSWFGLSRRQGLTPVEPSSTSAERIDDLYLFIAFFAMFIFLCVTIPLALIIAWYRERGLPREVEGPQIRGNVRLELLWTAIPVVIVIVLISFTLYKANGINDPASAAGTSVPIQVEGREFYFRYLYENGAIAVDRLRLPVGRVADLEITAPEWDVIHSFWVPALGGKMDAIPGVRNHLRILPERTGVFEGKCAELCGIQHTAMIFDVEVMPAAEFDRWVEQKAGEEAEVLGEELWQGVCLKCHFAAPEYAPEIIGNPILGDPAALEKLVTEGRNLMPAVGRGWSDRELEALTSYTRRFAGQGER